MPARLRYAELAPEGIAQMRSLEHYLNAASALPAVLLEMVRLRVSLRNGCEFCIGHHTRELEKHNEPESRIDALRDWESSDAFTPKERAALAWADAVTDIQTRHADDPAYREASIFFHNKDLVDLTLAIASINAWNRLSIAFRSEWDPNRSQKKSSPPLAPDADSPQKGTLAASHASAPPDPTATAAQSPSGTTPAHDDAPTEDVVDGDGAKVAQS